MPYIKSVKEHGNSILVLLDDGSNVTCYPTSGGLWIPANRGTTPPITDPPIENPTGFRFPFPRDLHTTYAGHSGADWAGDVVGNDAEVCAIGAGTVERVTSFSGNTFDYDSSEPIWRGNSITIGHGIIGGVKISTLYAHMDNPPSFNVGDILNSGEILGTVGNTGFSAGTHLHFEVIYNDSRLSTGQGGYERTIGWMDANANGSWR